MFRMVSGCVILVRCRQKLMHRGGEAGELKERIALATVCVGAYVASSH
jgi:hypothetical protein